MTNLDEISNYELFRTLPDDVLTTISSLMKIKKYNVGDVIIEQGQNNSTLYFLKSGSVQISVNDELVTLLEDKGAVFGEISVFFSQPSSAQVQARTDLECLLLDARYLDQIESKKRLTVELQLFKSYAAILSRRLVQTNEKAFRFEVANRDLLEAQNRLKKLNDLIADMAAKNAADISQSTSQILAKVKELGENHLQPILETFDQEGMEVPAKLRELIQATLNEIDPLSTHLTLESKMRQSRVLFIDPDRKQQTLAKMALGGAGVHLQAALNVEEAMNLRATQSFDVIFCDIALADAAAGLTGEQLVFMASTDVLANLAAIRDEDYFRNLITRDPEDRNFTVRNFLTSLAKLTTKNLFGIESYLTPGVQIYDLEITSSKDRRRIVEGMSEHYKKMGIRSMTITRMETVLEELLMNAIYDAPVDENGHPLFNHLPRTQDIVLDNQHAAHFRHGSDGNYVALSVTDPNGALEKQTIIKYLQSCYDGNAGSMNAEKGGAGRGLGMIIESSDLVVFNVWPQHKTEIICLYDLEAMQLRKIIPPSFHMYFL